MIVSHKQTMLMAQFNSPGNESPVSSRKRRGVMRMVKQSLRLDMTPMVDLGFLLITFFVITTELARPTVMDLYMPKDGGLMPVGESNALTVLVDNNKIYYYHGKWEDTIRTENILQTNFFGNNGLRNIIEKKQRQLDVIAKDKEGRNGLMLLIKPGSNASYKSIIDVLDETAISMVKKYALVKLSEAEANWLEKKDQ